MKEIKKEKTMILEKKMKVDIIGTLRSTQGDIHPIDVQRKVKERETLLEESIKNMDEEMKEGTTDMREGENHRNLLNEKDTWTR